MEWGRERPIRWWVFVEWGVGGTNGRGEGGLSLNSTELRKIMILLSAKRL
jgi:hypothetical protein